MDQIWRSATFKSSRKLAMLSVVASALLVGAGVEARGPSDLENRIALVALPVQAQQTRRLILAGGPFPHAKDGIVFGNREQLLPRRDRGYYREYTVPTPGSFDRGARRIVCGGRQPTRPDACYYTADHYASFRTIAP